MREGEGVEVGEIVRDVVLEALEPPPLLGDLEGDKDGVDVGEIDLEALEPPPLLEDLEGENDGVAVGEVVLEALVPPPLLGELEGDLDGDFVALADPVFVADRVAERDGLAPKLRVIDGVAVKLGVLVKLGVRDGVREGESDRERDCEGVAVVDGPLDPIATSKSSAQARSIPTCPLLKINLGIAAIYHCMRIKYGSAEKVQSRAYFGYLL